MILKNYYPLVILRRQSKPLEQTKNPPDLTLFLRLKYTRKNNIRKLGKEN